MANSLKFSLLVILAALLIYQEKSLYNKALKQGELNYKSSHRLYMAFKSAYHYGYMDCSEGRPESWEGEDE